MLRDDYTAMNLHTCPECGAAKGDRCWTRGGAELRTSIHARRRARGITPPARPVSVGRSTGRDTALILAAHDAGMRELVRHLTVTHGEPVLELGLDESAALRDALDALVCAGTFTVETVAQDVYPVTRELAAALRDAREGAR